MKFRKIARFGYNGKKFQLFMNESNKTAFLEIKDGKYHYPELEDLIEVNYYFNYYRFNGTMEIEFDGYRRPSFFTFTPKAVRLGALITLSAVLLTGCGAPARSRYNYKTNIPEPITTVSVNTDKEIEEDELDKNIVEIPEANAPTSSPKDDRPYNYPSETDDKYLQLLAPADDENDFRYASDYNDLIYVKYLYVRDAKNYQNLYGYSNVTVEDIRKRLNENKKISKEYKEFIAQYVEDWLTLYPGSDFSTLYHNLETLEVRTCTKSEMTRYTLSMTSVACYKRNENVIYVSKDISLDRDSDDYIVLTHELTHAARNAVYKRSDGYKVFVSFYDDMRMGLYVEEALITDFCYQLQGLGGKSCFYTLQSSYFRIILDAIDYNGADFMNHSVNYLIGQMDAYMGDDNYAYHVIALLDAEASLRYTPYLETDFSSFEELYQYLTRMYIKNNITTDMTPEEVSQKYDELVEELTYYFDRAKTPIELDLSVFEKEYNKCISELGLSNARSR